MDSVTSAAYLNVLASVIILIAALVPAVRSIAANRKALHGVKAVLFVLARLTPAVAIVAAWIVLDHAPSRMVLLLCLIGYALTFEGIAFLRSPHALKRWDVLYLVILFCFLTTAPLFSIQHRIVEQQSRVINIMTALVETQGAPVTAHTSTGAATTNPQSTSRVEQAAGGYR